VRWIRDRLDERHARRLRAAFGRRRWIVSWHLEDLGRWRARLSCPALVSTLERTGRTRTEAIERAARAVHHVLSLQGRFHPQDVRIDWDARSLDDPRR
jgi:hypothetical protein